MHMNTYFQLFATVVFFIGLAALPASPVRGNFERAEEERAVSQSRRKPCIVPCKRSCIYVEQ